MFSPLSHRARGLLAGASLAVAAACGAPAAVAGAPAGASAPPVPAAPRPVVPAARPSTARPAPGTGTLLWRFHAGSAVHAAPAVAADGTIYVGTADGIVQALSERGTLLWSYTIEGAVAWPPLVDASGRVFVATAAQRLYSFSSRGDLSWQLRAPAHVATEPALAPPWGLLFAGTDGNLWAYSEHAVALWHTRLLLAPSAGPAVLGTRSVVGASTGELVLLDGAMRRATCTLEGAVQSIPVVFRDGSAVVLAGGALHRIDARGAVVWRREGIAWASAGQSGLLVIDAEQALFRLGLDGGAGPKVALGARASASPREDRAGTAYVPAASGDLLVVRAGGEVRRWPVARAALHRPVIDEARGRVIVTAGSGEVAALALEE
jgi:outer membrane protein assembly factor BamB